MSVSSEVSFNVSEYSMEFSVDSECGEDLRPQVNVDRADSSEYNLSSRVISDETLVARLNPITGFTIKEFTKLKTRLLKLENATKNKRSYPKRTQREIKTLNARLTEYNSIVSVLRESRTTMNEVRVEMQSSLRSGFDEPSYEGRGVGAGAGAGAGAGGGVKSKQVRFDTLCYSPTSIEMAGILSTLSSDSGMSMKEYHDLIKDEKFLKPHLKFMERSPVSTRTTDFNIHLYSCKKRIKEVDKRLLYYRETFLMLSR